mmetsp:Transcript_300/g.920  ORF Transcript_300/g.920 Transcript_300/m.920 type:complete len:295 (-) Transcript_300:164-1048(-)
MRRGLNEDLVARHALGGALTQIGVLLQEPLRLGGRGAVELLVQGNDAVAKLLELVGLPLHSPQLHHKALQRVVIDCWEGGTDHVDLRLHGALKALNKLQHLEVLGLCRADAVLELQQGVGNWRVDGLQVEGHPAGDGGVEHGPPPLLSKRLLPVGTCLCLCRKDLLQAGDLVLILLGSSVLLLALSIGQLLHQLLNLALELVCLRDVLVLHHHLLDAAGARGVSQSERSLTCGGVCRACAGNHATKGGASQGLLQELRELGFTEWHNIDFVWFILLGEGLDDTLKGEETLVDVG